MPPLPTPSEFLQAFIYPPCLLAGLLSGLLIRRLPLAAALAFIAAPLVDDALGTAFSDTAQHLFTVDALVFGIVAALLAAAVCALKRALRPPR